MWSIRPLKGKYYGTILECSETDDIIEIWLSSDYTPSERELADGWTPDKGFDHVESQLSYKTALKLLKALNEIS